MNPALQAYSATARTGLAGRALEAAVLQRCATDLQRAAAQLPSSTLDLFDALERNRKAWRLFVAEARDPDTHLPDSVRRNVLVMGAFVFKRTIEICDAPEATNIADLVNPMIDLNRQLAAGLEGR
jgi:flagellar biosynthesis regulator FlaF